MNEIIAKRRNTLILGIICLAVAVCIALLLLIDEVREDKIIIIVIILLFIVFICGSIASIIFHFLKSFNLIELNLDKLIINKSKNKKETVNIDSITYIGVQNETSSGHTYSHGTLTICTENDCYVVKDIKNLKAAYLRLYDLCKDNILADAKKEFEENRHNTSSCEPQIIAKRTSIAKLLFFVIIGILIICAIFITIYPEDWIYSLVAGLIIFIVFSIFIIKEVLKIKDVVILNGNKITINVSRKEQIETSINEIAAVEVLFKKKDLNDCPLQISLKDSRKIILKDITAPLMVCDEIKAIISDNVI